MICLKQLPMLLTLLVVLLSVVVAEPDGGDTHPLPGPGLAYGGIPYGSMSGDVANYFRQKASPIGRAAHNNVDFAPIEQWLR